MKDNELTFLTDDGMAKESYLLPIQGTCLGLAGVASGCLFLYLFGLFWGSFIAVPAIFFGLIWASLCVWVGITTRYTKPFGTSDVDRDVIDTAQKLVSATGIVLLGGLIIFLLLGCLFI